MKHFLPYFLVLLVSAGYGQNQKAWILFKDKPTADFDPYTYFSQENIDRKLKQGLPLYDKYDLPVSESYMAQITPLCDSITYVSRWLNAACVYASHENIAIIKALPCVREIEISDYEVTLCANDFEKKLVHLNDLHGGELQLLKAQTNRMNAGAFHKQGIMGKGVTVAIIDAGFTGYKKNPLLKLLRDNNQIKHTWNFIKKTADVDNGSPHGTAVLSCVGGKIDSVYIGLAPEANFLLYRTEKAFNEKISEEEYWMAAMEEADKKGADIINTSLGYSTRRYFEKDMNGKTSLLAKAANIANRKGMLLVCSAGNEGDIDWKVICTPADADSALTVGALNPWTGVQASWSSYGPTADKRLKPNVCAYGYVMAAERADGLGFTLGTSFSSPLTAGFAACVRQINPQLTAYELLKKIEASGDLFPYYDYIHGYGVPQASNILTSNMDSVSPAFEIRIENDSLKVILSDHFFAPAHIPVTGYFVSKEDEDLTKKEFEGNDYPYGVHIDDHAYGDPTMSYAFVREPGYFYYKRCATEGNYIEEYGVLNVRQRLIYTLARNQSKQKYTFHYKDYTQTVEW